MKRDRKHSEEEQNEKIPSEEEEFNNLKWDLANTV
jgi:hypothetical protein